MTNNSKVKAHLRLLIFLPMLLGGLVFISGCRNDGPLEDVVARVNGVPIFLKDVELGYDFHFFEWSDPLPPSVRQLQDTYGRVLLDCILIELIRTELDARNVRVRDEEILALENEIRGDYPEGAFEKMLVEEYIDLNYWRTRIRNRLMWERFADRVLMPGISIEPEEISGYYYSNIDSFYVPPRLVYLYLKGDDQTLLENALQDIEKNEHLERLDRLRDKYGSLMIIRHEMRMDHLPQYLARDLLALAPGESTSVMREDQIGFYALYLVEKKDEQVLKPYQVYNIIEKKILDERMAAAFNQWLAKVLEDSTIEINSVLLESLTRDSQ